MSDPLVQLTRRVETVKQRRLGLSRVAGGLAAIGGLIAAFLAFSLLDIVFQLPVPLRVAALLGGVAVLGVLLYRYVVRPLFDWVAPAHVAGEIEQQFPEIENTLSTSIEYGADPEKTRTHSSPDIVDELIRDTAQRTESIDFRRTVNTRSALPVVGFTMLVLLLAAGYYSAVPHMFGATLKRFINPIDNTAPPTWTLLRDPLPGDMEVPRGGEAEIVIYTGGWEPDDATIFYREDREGAEWQQEPMRLQPAGDGSRRFAHTFSRLLRDVDYYVTAGDAMTPSSRITVYAEPRIETLQVTVTPPAYTGQATSSLPADSGDVRALEGARVEVTAQATKPIVGGYLDFDHADRTDAELAEDNPRTIRAAFTVNRDDAYRIKVRDSRGRENSKALTFRINALKDAPPKVEIIVPEKDTAAKTDGSIELKIRATDEFGVREIGIYETVEDEQDRTLLRRIRPGAPSDEQREATVETELELSGKGYQGGEIITIYAYALDGRGIEQEERVDGRLREGEGRSDLRFVTVVGVQEYQGQGGQQPPPQAKKAAEAIGKLIKRQQEILRGSFRTARQIADAEIRKDEEVRELHQDESRRLGAKQKALMEDTRKLHEATLRELQQDAERGVGAPPELQNLELAADKMNEALPPLEEAQTYRAIRPETEALRKLSQARRLLLSRSSSRMGQAMQQGQQQQEDQQRQRQAQQQQQVEKELQELANLLNEQQELERQLERLEREERQPEPPQQRPQDSPQSQAEQRRQEREEKKKEERKRRLKDRSKEEAKKLAQKMQQRSEQLQKQSQENPELDPRSSRQMQQASQQMQQAAQQMQQGQTPQARESVRQSGRHMRNAQQEMLESLERQQQNRMQQAMSQVGQMLERQRQLAQQTAEAARRLQQAREQQSAAQNNPEQQQQAREQADAARQSLQNARQNQEDLRQGLNELSQQLREMAETAQRQQRPSRESLEEAQRQSADGNEIDRLMNMAREWLKDAAETDDARREQDAAQAARNLQQAAQSELQELMENLQAAQQADNRREAAALAEAVKQLQQLRGKQQELGQRIQQQAANPANSEQLAQQQRELQEQTANIQHQAQSAATETGDQGLEQRTDQNLQQARRAMAQSAEALERRQSPAARDAALEAEKSLARALNDLQQALDRDLLERLRKTLDTAREAADAQRQAAETVDEAHRRTAESSSPRPFTEGETDQLQRDQRTSAEQAAQLQQQVEAATAHAQSAESPVAELLRETQRKMTREDLARRADELAQTVQQAASQQPGTDEEKQAQVRQLAEMEPQAAELRDDLEDVRRRMEAVVAEAEKDELQRLQSAQQAAQDAADDLRDLQKQMQKLAEERERRMTKAQTSSEERDPLAQQKKQLAEDATDLRDSLDFLQQRLQQMGKQQQNMRKVQEAREQVAAETRRTLDLNQNPSRSNPLTRSAGKMEQISHDLLRQIETLEKSRILTTDDDAPVPEGFERFVEDYFRAVSEDGVE